MEQLCNIVTHAHSRKGWPKSKDRDDISDKITPSNRQSWSINRQKCFTFSKTLLRRNRSLLPYQPICLALEIGDVIQRLVTRATLKFLGGNAA